MRRSVCYAEPPFALAGQITTWKLVYTTATRLHAGARLRFDLLSNGRDIDWQMPTADLSAGSNMIYGLMPDGELVEAKEVENPESFLPQFEFVLPEEIPSGGEFYIYLGALPDEGGELSVEDGNAAQTTVQRRRPFHLLVDAKGEGQFEDPEVFTIDIRGNVLSNIRVLTPSYVVKGKRFDVTVRFEDEFGNLTANAPEDTLIELTYEHLRENLNWKLFVPETGFITLPNLYFNEPGVYTIRLKNLLSGQEFKSAPLLCFTENSKQLFWGLLHGESDRVDSTENIEACLRHFRDDTAMNFFATSASEDPEETPNDIWRMISQNVTDFNEDDRFTTLLGFQWAGDTKKEGARHFVYAKDGKSILRKKDAKSATLERLYRHLAAKEAIAIPCFTMAQSAAYDFKNFDPEYERVVEIYNAWGSSECSEKEGNPFPIKVPPRGKGGVKEYGDGSVLKALLSGLRFGFSGGGLDDRGVYASLFDSDQMQYHPGMTAIIATGHSRSALFEALYQRSCYATTGRRIILDMQLAGTGIGQEVSTQDKPGLLVNRHIAGYVAGMEDLESVEIIRNGEVIHRIEPEGPACEYAYDDMEPLSSVALKAKHAAHPFVFYYLRVTQKDGHMAWGSPIWVDQISESQPKRRGRPAKS